jgi:hypothetical protein
VRLLQGRDEPVGAERHDASTDEADAAVLTNALPHQPRTTDLGHGGEHEQRE